MWWAIGTTIAALMAWVAWYERENRRGFQRMMDEYNEQLRAQLHRELERNEINRRLDVYFDDKKAHRKPSFVSRWPRDKYIGFHMAVCNYWAEWAWNKTQKTTRKRPDGGLRQIARNYGYKGNDMKGFFTRHFMSVEEYNHMIATGQVPEHFANVCSDD